MFMKREEEDRRRKKKRRKQAWRTGLMSEKAW